MRVIVLEETADIVPTTSICLNPAELNLMAGDTGQLGTAVYPLSASFKGVDYISDTPGVANVDENGLVTAYEPGTAQITVVSQDNPAITAISKVIVGGQPSIEPQAIILDQVRLNLVAGGQQATLNANVLPSTVIDRSITWNSDNPEIASVDHDGIITPKARGTALITASTSDGKHRAYCQVNVSLAAVPVQDVDIYPQVINLEQDGLPAYARTVITPVDATNQDVKWVSGDETVALIDASGQITPRNPGRAIIQAITRGADATGNPQIANAMVIVSRLWQPEDPSHFENVVSAKTWVISFNKSIDMEETTINEAVKILDRNNQTIEATVKLTDNGKKLEVTPEDDLPAGEYHLFIDSSNLVSESGQELNSSIKAYFTVE